MAITNIPTWVDGEILTAAKLNLLGTAVSTKFSGAITGADLAWPFTAQGNIDMGSQYSIVNLRTMWNVVNVAEYDTFADAVAALPSAGGSLFIEPGTVTTDGSEIDTSNVMVFGTGRGSVLKLTTSATSGYLVRTTAGLADIGFVNMTIDGNSNTGSGQDGIQVRDIDGFHMSHCWLKNFSGTHLSLTHSGTPGNPTENAIVESCHFLGGSGDHLKLIDVDGARVVNCYFDSPTTKGINGTPASTSAAMRSILVAGCKFSSAANSIYIIGASGTANDLWRLVQVQGNEILSDSATAITVGTASAIIKFGMVQNNVAVSITGDGVKCLMSTGMVSNNYLPSMGGDGVDCSSSADMVVSDNVLSDSGAYGVDAQSTTNCRICKNDVHNPTTEGVIKDSATGLDAYDNFGDLSMPHTSSVYEGTQSAHTGDTNESTEFTKTIKAGALLQTGSGLRIDVTGEHSGAGSTTVRVKFGGSNIISHAGISGDAYHATGIAIITGASAQRVFGMSIEDATAAGQSVGNGTLAIDNTADVDVTVTLQNTDAGGTSTVDGVLITLFNGEAQSV